MGLGKVACYLLPTGVGVGIGYLGSLYGKVSAAANVSVRPELANVDLLSATLSGHPTHWLFYHYPDQITIAAMVVGALAGLFLGSYISHVRRPLSPDDIQDIQRRGRWP